MKLRFIALSALAASTVIVGFSALNPISNRVLAVDNNIFDPNLWPNGKIGGGNTGGGNTGGGNIGGGNTGGGNIGGGNTGGGNIGGGNTGGGNIGGGNTGGGNIGGGNTGGGNIGSGNNVSSQAAFACIQSNGGYATVARTASGETTLITWNNRSFGPQYTPSERCQQVTGRLQSYVSTNGNDISNLLLTTGRVNGQAVICVVNNGQLGCNNSNVLVTLSGQNAADPGQALAQFLNRSRGNISGSPLQERQGKQVIPLGNAVNGSFSSSRSILENAGLQVVNCDPSRASLIAFDNSKLCVNAVGPLQPGGQYYYNSSTGKITQ
ncbi:COP23 domain-containing protein [Limnoraphis robusta Tam1]|uniref:COP23 domain-containing protein n=1 Tax=Limnoraphis robusta TaxID=1118279 RepID=UPI002B218221|nr:COP23 domain-containing protein [Limnoraphis robusta]MEA5542989.1 COP23 domain-containing protein [Limnoraphis robusta Tam1]